MYKKKSSNIQFLVFCLLDFIDKNIKINAEHGGLICEVLEESLNTSLGPFAIFNYDSVVHISWG